MATSSDANHLVTANPNTQQIEVTMELATDLMFGGNISPVEEKDLIWEIRKNWKF